MPAPTRPRAVGVPRRLAAERFALLTAGSVLLLPPRIRRAVPADMVGYAVLGAVTFVVDVAALVLLDRTTSLPLALSVVLADLLAWAVHFQLNRTLNFRSVAPIGPEALRYGVVVVGCLAVSAGVTTAVAALGAPTAVARIVAGAVLALIGYVACRWWVFRHHPIVID